MSFSLSSSVNFAPERIAIRVVLSSKVSTNSVRPEPMMQSTRSLLSDSPFDIEGNYITQLFKNGNWSRIDSRISVDMKARIVKSLQKATGIKETHLEFPENEAHGDYATNIALVSAKKKEKKA